MAVVENTICWPGLFTDLLHDKTDQDMNNNGYMYVSMKEQEEKVKGLQIS